MLIFLQLIIDLIEVLQKLLREMISIAVSQLQFYQTKIYRLEMDVIGLEDQLQTIKSKSVDQYKIKYELLLETLAQQNQLKNSKISEGNALQEKAVADLNQKWENMMQEKMKDMREQIQMLTQEKTSLKSRLVEIDLKNVRLQRQLDEGDSEVLNIKLTGLRKENQRLRKQSNQAYEQCDRQIVEIKKQLETRVQETKEREKSYYRDQIGDLEKTVEELERTLESERLKLSPQREAMIATLQKQIAKSKTEHDEELFKLVEVVEKRNKQFHDYKVLADKKQQINLETVRDLNNELKELERKLFQNGFSRDIEISQMQKDMSQKRQKEADDLKMELERIEQEFKNQRQQWKNIIQHFQQENSSIKKKWEQEKKKYIQEKTRLKAKITELKLRLKCKQQQEGNGETELLIKSLKQMNNNQQQFSSYENAITFMDRQVKKAAIKINEKDRQINNLIQQLKNQQEQTQKQINYVKQKSRTQIKALYQKIFTLETEVDEMNQKIIQKDKSIKKKQNDLSEEKEGHQIQSQNLRKVIQEMERDYKRLVGNKKNLQQSFRQERQNVITGKVDINQQRKKKWIQLGRQKNQMEIVYRERQIQMKQESEIAVDKLKREKLRIIQEKEQLRAEVQLLKERLGIDKQQDKQNKYIEYQKKLATLDLQISLTKNLFNTLSVTAARQNQHRKTEFDQVSQKQSQRISSEHSFELKVSPPLAPVDTQKDDGFKNAGFSFFPYRDSIK